MLREQENFQKSYANDILWEKFRNSSRKNSFCQSYLSREISGRKELEAEFRRGEARSPLRTGVGRERGVFGALRRLGAQRGH
jgi:hypothetical protein